jgi:hypothetical protein
MNVAQIEKKLGFNPVDKLSALNDGFGIFVGHLKKFVKLTKEHHKSLDRTNLNKLDAHNKWMGSLVEMASLDPIRFATNVATVSKSSMVPNTERIAELDRLANSRPASIINQQVVTNQQARQVAEQQMPSTIEGIKEYMEQLNTIQSGLIQLLQSVDMKMEEIANHLKSGVLKTREVDANNLFG